MAGPAITNPSDPEVSFVAPENRSYQKMRAQPPSPEETEQELRYVNKWVARRKSDAKIVAEADDYEGLEKVLAEMKVDPNSVVMGFVHDPSEIYVD